MITARPEDMSRLNGQERQRLGRALADLTDRKLVLETYAITASRTWFDWRTMWSALSLIPGNAVMFNGMANGGDCLARSFWLTQGRSVRPFRPPWSQGKHAGLIRNTIMMEHMPQLVVGFIADDGPSNGTRDALHKAQERGIPTFVFWQHIPPEQRLSDSNPTPTGRIAPAVRGMIS